MAENTLNIELESSDKTAGFAVKLASKLSAGDTVLLSGDVGAGKSFFARAMITSLLTQPEDIPSPTFTLVQTYDTEIGALWHADLYRLSSDFEVEELGLLDAMSDAVCVIEWPDRLGEYMPKNALNINLSAGKTDEARHMSISWSVVRWQTAMIDWERHVL